MSKQTDNHAPAAKLDLRRYFLAKYHATPPRVLDCCQGSGYLWSVLSKEFPPATYWGIDKKVKKGRLRVDSRRVLALPGWEADVVDIDTYGSPWPHWLAMLPSVRYSLTVFLTWGSGGPGRVKLGHEELDAMGLTLKSVKAMSGAITHNLVGLARACCLAKAADFGLELAEVKEAVTGGNAAYYGVRLERA
jgi:hypothetical protein